MKMKKLISLVLAIALAFSAMAMFTACGKDETIETPIVQNEPQPDPEPQPEPEPEPEPEPQPEPEPPTPDPVQSQMTVNPLDDGVWNMRLVNKLNSLPEGFSVDTVAINGGKEFDSRAAKYLEAFLADGRKAGHDLIFVSGYRSVSYQKGLVDRNVKSLMADGMSEDAAIASTYKVIAVPGTSEHNLGLAADIAIPGHTDLTERFASTSAYTWLKENCYKYGFIERFPKNKEEITGIIYEPWHYRYVGLENAEKIHQAGLCLEEYLGAEAVGF